MGTAQLYYPAGGPASLPVLPGRYAVVGPGESNAAYQTSHPKLTYIGFCIGRPIGFDAKQQTRHIDLSTSTFPIVGSNMNSSGGTAFLDATRPLPASVNVPQVLAIDTPRRLSVSEPRGRL